MQKGYSALGKIDAVSRETNVLLFFGEQFLNDSFGVIGAVATGSTQASLMDDVIAVVGAIDDGGFDGGDIDFSATAKHSLIG